jgi:hypothetical protein
MTLSNLEGAHIESGTGIPFTQQDPLPPWACALRAHPRSARTRAPRAPALRAFLGGLYVIVTQFPLLVIGIHAHSASRNSRAQSGVLLARRGIVLCKRDSCSWIIV